MNQRGDLAEIKKRRAEKPLNGEQMRWSPVAFQ
jgi:hypothetical protein